MRTSATQGTSSFFSWQPSSSWMLCPTKPRGRSVLSSSTCWQPQEAWKHFLPKPFTAPACDQVANTPSGGACFTLSASAQQHVCFFNSQQWVHFQLGSARCSQSSSLQFLRRGSWWFPSSPALPCGAGQAIRVWKLASHIPNAHLLQAQYAPQPCKKGIFSPKAATWPKTLITAKSNNKFLNFQELLRRNTVCKMGDGCGLLSFNNFYLLTIVLCTSPSCSPTKQTKCNNTSLALPASIPTFWLIVTFSNTRS